MEYLTEENVICMSCPITFNCEESVQCPYTVVLKYRGTKHYDCNCKAYHTSQ